MDTTERIGIIIQARMSSTRLPGKSLRELGGKPMLQVLCERLQCIRAVDILIVAVSDQPSDDRLAHLVQTLGVHLFRGDLSNVQKRYYDAAVQYGLDVIIRVTGDNPFTSPKLIERMIDEWRTNRVDYIACDKCILGTGAELFTRESFEHVCASSPSTYDEEHVTPPYYQQQGRFRTSVVTAPPVLQHPSLSLTVDTEDDFERIRSLFHATGNNPEVPLPEIIRHYTQGA